MWHVALQCHAGADILLKFHLFSYCCEVVQIVSQLSNTHTTCVLWGVGGFQQHLQNIVHQISEI